MFTWANRTNICLSALHLNKYKNEDFHIKNKKQLTL